jgi:hypothetical protein
MIISEVNVTYCEVLSYYVHIKNSLVPDMGVVLR